MLALSMKCNTVVLTVVLTVNYKVVATQGDKTCAKGSFLDVWDDSADLTLLQKSLIVQHKKTAASSYRSQPVIAPAVPPPSPISIFQDVLLVIHCRQEPDICNERKPLLDLYGKFFKAVKHMNSQEGSCPEGQSSGDPHLCLSRIMEDDGGQYDGVLYMHFDAVLSPCGLGQHFDPTRLGLFGTTPTQLEVARIEWLDSCKSDLSKNCSWQWWDTTGIQKKGWLDSVSTIKQLVDMHRIPSQELEWMDVQLWKGVDDLFYIPKTAYTHYSELAKVFARNGVFHEIAGPSMRQIMHTHLSIPVQDLGCIGGCIVLLQPPQLENVSFQCGHKVDYTQESALRAVQTLLMTDAACAAPSPYPMQP
eukprot:gnl/MRDRNA2_/MRDRNA2_110708_c0_seq1.p1 gnl/MRDRNA2_/MRDRNA2_110708_c0~~gnl/MRDRNA2_/MRDRNA2_110708_c0_seq1.p1  ORF type:complete len:362 (+),score=34.04 gnl/MRDRNA2_/MRDRNA2_110708_c0_seq1:119-1204(+)